MANKGWRDFRFKIAGSSTSVLSDISDYINQELLASAITMLDQTGMGANATVKDVLNGLPEITVQLNGFVNTTTEGILGPIIKGTSVKKRFEVQRYTGRYYNGSVLPSNIQFSGSPATLQTWSATFTFAGTFNRTSVALT